MVEAPLIQGGFAWRLLSLRAEGLQIRDLRWGDAVVPLHHIGHLEVQGAWLLILFRRSEASQPPQRLRIQAGRLHAEDRLDVLDRFLAAHLPATALWSLADAAGLRWNRRVSQAEWGGAGPGPSRVRIFRHGYALDLQGGGCELRGTWAPEERGERVLSMHQVGGAGLEFHVVGDQVLDPRGCVLGTFTRLQHSTALERQHVAGFVLHWGQAAPITWHSGRRQVWQGRLLGQLEADADAVHLCLQQEVPGILAWVLPAVFAFCERHHHLEPLRHGLIHLGPGGTTLRARLSPADLRMGCLAAGCLHLGCLPILAFALLGLMQGIRSPGLILVALVALIALAVFWNLSSRRFRPGSWGRTPVQAQGCLNLRLGRRSFGRWCEDLFTDRSLYAPATPLDIGHLDLQRPGYRLDAQYRAEQRHDELRCSAAETEELQRLLEVEYPGAIWSIQDEAGLRHSRPFGLGDLLPGQGLLRRFELRTEAKGITRPRIEVPGRAYELRAPRSIWIEDGYASQGLVHLQ